MPVLSQLLTQKQQQQQHLSAQQLQLIKLLELSAQEFEQRVQNELEENPALDAVVESDDIPISVEDHDEVPVYTGNLYRSSNPYSSPITPDRAANFHTLLLQQLSLLPLSDSEQQLCIFFVGCLESDGYLRRPLGDIANDLLFVQNIEADVAQLQKMLCIVQTLEPAGIAARNLQECLLLQLQRKQPASKNTTLAIQIMTAHFEDFTLRHYNKLADKLGISLSQLKKVVDEITKLDPKPGSSFSENDNTFVASIIPDFVVEYKNGELQQSLVERHTPKLFVSREYQKMAHELTANNKDAHQFVAQKVSDANGFITMVQQRNNTMSVIMNAIAAHQKQFFMTGNEADLQPLTQQAIAHKTGYDASTISRVIGNKYVQTNFGVLPLKSFFVGKSRTTDGDEVAVSQIKQTLADIVKNEDPKHPLLDAELVEQLHQRGFTVARRTVAKYREQLNIGTTRMRQKL
ncbi:RNA polymerase sigma-54 factor [Bacteroidia bacterium]|nr:RNA polymerase sigma-54 factor [Bacteroidia bacterium]